LENIRAWEEVFANENRILCVLHLSCDLDICKKRLLKRSETSNRTDDQEEIIEKRFKGFLEENEPILNQMGTKTKVIRIDSSKEKEKVFEEVCELIEKII
jgi:adenylate kinase family enzyme